VEKDESLAMSTLERARIVQLIRRNAEKLHFGAHITSQVATFVHLVLDSSPCPDKPETIGIFICACLFLGGKVGDCFRSLRDVINVQFGFMPVLEYDQIKLLIIQQEEVILRTLQLDLESHNDHFNYLLNVCNYIVANIGEVKTAIKLLNDMFLVRKILEFNSQTLAIASLYVSLNLHMNNSNNCNDNGNDGGNDNSNDSRNQIQKKMEMLSKLIGNDSDSDTYTITDTITDTNTVFVQACIELMKTQLLFKVDGDSGEIIGMDNVDG